MSSAHNLNTVTQIVQTLEPQFNKLAQTHNAVTWAQECGYALQILKGNDYLTRVAAGNQDSLKDAVLNVAAIGLTLSPVEKLAYLVPRKNKVCLDVSYQGHVKLATDAGAILWAKAELVYAKDEFRTLGPNTPPQHIVPDYFGDRGSIVGGYVLAKTPGGEYLVDLMSIAEIYSIRDRSESWKAWRRDPSISCPWKTDELEMIKKTLIRRAYKSWPKTDSRPRLDRAIAASDVADGIDLSAPALPAAAAETEREKTLKEIRGFLSEIDRSEEQYVKYLTTTHRREIKSLEEMTPTEMTQAKNMLNALALNARKKKGTVNENAG